jgi:hypothetical protein
MNVRYRRSSDVATVLGVIGISLGCWLLFYHGGFDTLGKSSLVVGALLLYLAILLYALAKGYPAWWCLLLFIIGPGAFFVFWILPDRHHEHADKLDLPVIGR